MKNLITAASTELIISSSRTLQEIMQIANGNTVYGTLAYFINTSTPYLDNFAESMGNIVAQSVVSSTYDKQYFNPQYGSFKNFLTRNIYLSKDKRIEMENERYIKGYFASAATETGIKLLSRGIQKALNKKDKSETFSRINILLSSYAILDSKNSNQEGAVIELAKIRNAFPISKNQKESLRQKTLSLYSNPISTVDVVDSLSLSGNEDDSYRKSLAFLLSAIHLQKYGDYSGESQAMRNLRNYYSILGYHGDYARELIFENENNYNKIANDQKAYLSLARGIVKNLIISVPEIDAERLQLQAAQMAKYDPYSKRRKTVQSAAKITLSALVDKNPELVINAAATALSQIKLENDDNALEFLEHKFKDNNVGSDIFNIILSQRKCINSYVEDNN